MQGKVLALVGLAEFLQMTTLIDFRSQRNCWSGKVSANEIYKVSTTKEIPVTAESTNAEAEAMKLGPMDGGRELKEKENHFNIGSGTNRQENQVKSIQTWKQWTVPRLQMRTYSG